MNPKPNNTGKQKALSKKSLIAYACLLIFILIGAIIFLYMDISARYAYKQLHDESDAVSMFINDRGGIEIADRSDSRGDGLISHLTCQPALDCPYIIKKFFIPVTPGEELILVKDVAALGGYTYKTDDMSTSGCIELNPSTGSCGIESKKAGYKKGVAVQKVEPQNPPSQSVSPKNWRIIGVRFE